MKKTKKMEKMFQIHENYDVVLACCSGGKDSTVTTYLSSLHVPIEKLYVLYYDIPWNFPGTTELVQKFCQDLGLNLLIAKTDVNMEQCLKKYGPPNIRNRWCTRVTKVEPSRKAVNLFPDSSILFIDGSRAEESKSRSRLEFFTPNSFVDGQDVLHPILDWSEKRVWNLIRSEGLPIHPIYYWSNRLSCYCCPLQSLGSWQCLRKYHPDLWLKSIELEEIADRPWLSGFKWLRDLEPHVFQPGLEDPTVITRKRRIKKKKPLEVRE